MSFALRSLSLRPDALRPYLTHGALYTVAIGIEAFVPFLLLPILSRMLTPGDYGIWVIFVSLYSFFRPVVSLHFEDAIRASFFKEDEDARHELILASVAISFLVMTAVLLLVTCFRTSIGSWSHFPADWLWSTIVTAYVYGIFYIFLAAFQFRHEPLQFVRLEILHTILSLICVLAFLAMGLDWRGAILGRFVGVSVAVLVAWPALSRKAPFRLRVSSSWRTLLWFGFRYLPVGLGIVVVPLMNRLLIAHSLGLEAVGLFGVGSLFGAVVGIFSKAFLLVWQPKLFRALQLSETGSEQREALSSVLVFSLCIPLSAGVIILVSQYLLPVLVPASYAAAVPLIPWCVWAVVGQAYFDQHQSVLLSRHCELAMSLSYAVVMVVCGLLGSLWVSDRGPVGVAQATLAAYLVGTAVNGLLVVRVLRR